MEKRVIGMILTFLGIAGLILGAVNFMNGGSNTRNVKRNRDILCPWCYFLFCRD